MRVFKLIYILYKIRLLSPLALFRLFSAIYQYGVNLAALLHFSARTYKDRVALADELETLTYAQLFAEARELSIILEEKYQLASGKKAGILCQNHASLIKSIFAISATGADLYLLHAEMSRAQLQHILEHHDFDLLIYDEDRSFLLEQAPYTKTKLLSYHDTLPAVSNLRCADAGAKKKPRRPPPGKLVLMTGGTTGRAKEAAHQPSLWNYLNPFFAFVVRLNILKYRSAYIATPIFHGYGIAVLLLFTALGKKVVVRRGFDAEKACRLIREHQIETVTVVPLMLRRMLQTNSDDLKSLRCIASGGAELSPRLAAETLNQLGAVLYNLYGTSEAGLNMIATPQDLALYPHTIGRKIWGSRLKIVNEHHEEVEIGQPGQFCFQNHWSMKTGARDWIETGDWGYRNEAGYYFLCGRKDSMIVSAGENVYPLEVEQVLTAHPVVEDAAVIGIRDEDFGQRLKAFVLLAPQVKLTEEELFEWLRSRLARFQMPKEIIFVEQLPYTPLGKVDKKLLN